MQRKRKNIEVAILITSSETTSEVDLTHWLRNLCVDQRIVKLI